MYPLICTSNTQSHVDYGIPLVASKSTDYRTSTGTYHRFIPKVPEKFNCRVQTKIKPELKEVDVTIRDDSKSIYTNTFNPLPRDPTEMYFERAKSLKGIHYVRNVEEHILKNPPPPITPKLSEMKDSYRMNYYRSKYREVLPPSQEARCEIEGLARPLQPAINPGDHGHWKYLDIYMTDNRLRFPPYTVEEMERSREDLPTYYSATGKYKKLKVPLPGPSTGNKSVYDVRVFKKRLPLRYLSRAPKNVPNMQFKTEYSGSYVSQRYSDVYPYIHSNGVNYGASQAEAGPWQNLCPPGMYCTEACHIGTGWPVRAVVDIGPDEPLPPHNKTDKNEKNHS